MNKRRVEEDYVVPEGGHFGIQPPPAVAPPPSPPSPRSESQVTPDLNNSRAPQSDVHHYARDGDSRDETDAPAPPVSPLNAKEQVFAAINGAVGDPTGRRLGDNLVTCAIGIKHFCLSTFGMILAFTLFGSILYTSQIAPHLSAPIHQTQFFGLRMHPPSPLRIRDVERYVEAYASARRFKRDQDRGDDVTTTLHVDLIVNTPQGMPLDSFDKNNDGVIDAIEANSFNSFQAIQNRLWTAVQNPDTGDFEDPTDFLQGLNPPEKVVGSDDPNAVERNPLVIQGYVSRLLPIHVSPSSPKDGGGCQHFTQYIPGQRVFEDRLFCHDLNQMNLRYHSDPYYDMQETRRAMVQTGMTKKDADEYYRNKNAHLRQEKSKYPINVERRPECICNHHVGITEPFAFVTMQSRQIDAVPGDVESVLMIDPSIVPPETPGNARSVRTEIENDKFGNLTRQFLKTLSCSENTIRPRNVGLAYYTVPLVRDMFDYYGPNLSDPYIAVQRAYNKLTQHYMAKLVGLNPDIDSDLRKLAEPGMLAKAAAVFNTKTPAQIREHEYTIYIEAYHSVVLSRNDYAEKTAYIPPAPKQDWSISVIDGLRQRFGIDHHEHVNLLGADDHRGKSHGTNGPVSIHLSEPEERRRTPKLLKTIIKDPEPDMLECAVQCLQIKAAAADRRLQHLKLEAAHRRSLPVDVQAWETMPSTIKLGFPADSDKTSVVPK